MKIVYGKKKVLFFLVLGFFIGILYANLCAKSYLFANGNMTMEDLRNYLHLNGLDAAYDKNALLWLLIEKRGLLFLVAILGIAGRRKQFFVYGMVLWTGFAVAVMNVMMVLMMGIKGIWGSFLLLFPQWIFYGMSFWILLTTTKVKREEKLDIQKMAAIILFFLAGIVTECYVNPLLLR